MVNLRTKGLMGKPAMDTTASYNPEAIYSLLYMAAIMPAIRLAKHTCG